MARIRQRTVARFLKLFERVEPSVARFPKLFERVESREEARPRSAVIELTSRALHYASYSTLPNHMYLRPLD